MPSSNMNNLVWAFICRRGPLKPMPFTTTKVIKRRVIKQEITLQLPSVIMYGIFFIWARTEQEMVSQTTGLNRHNKDGFEGKGWSHSGETPAEKQDTRKRHLQDEWWRSGITSMFDSSHKTQSHDVDMLFLIEVIRGFSLTFLQLVWSEITKILVKYRRYRSVFSVSRTDIDRTGTNRKSENNYFHFTNHRKKRIKTISVTL